MNAEAIYFRLRLLNAYQIKLLEHFYDYLELYVVYRTSIARMGESKNYILVRKCAIGRAHRVHQISVNRSKILSGREHVLFL